MLSDDIETSARLTEAGHGDERAVRWLLEHHRPRLKRMIAVRLDDRLSARVDPSDVVQEALVDAARRLDTYLRERPLPFYPWLHRLASERLAQVHRHHLGALLREAGREYPGGIPRAETSGLRLVDLLAASGSSPSQHLIREEDRQEVWRALSELAAQDREILVMRYLDELSFAEIAAVVGVSEGTARVRHFRAIQRIGPLLGIADERQQP